ncbi:ABC transporter permease [Candidatus Bipolaricaulota bacterium]|nr:ABC transporter permease [Candidatus Bipolaricaulota bacterium]
MLKYVAIRILGIIPVLFFVALLSFAIVAIYPGDHFTVYKLRLALDGNQTTRAEAEQMVSELRALRGLDKPWYAQFWFWFEGAIIRGDFGYSFQTDRPVNRIIFSSQGGLGWTLLIMVTSIAWAWLLGVPTGILSAVRYQQLADHCLTAITYGIAASPPQLLGLLFLFFVYKYLDPLIIAGGVWGLVGYQFANQPASLAKTLSTIWHLVPVWFIVGAPVYAAISQHLRVSLLSTMPLPYLTTAYGKGLSNATVLWKHALRNALNPLVSMSGYMISMTVTGSLLASHFLGLPSFGRTFMEALQRQDQPVITSILLLYGGLLVIGTLLSDLLLLFLDPRIRYV